MDCEYGPMIEYMSRMYEAPGSSPRTAQNKKIMNLIGGRNGLPFPKLFLAPALYKTFEHCS